jgi:hypothetical protein
MAVAKETARQFFLCAQTIVEEESKVTGTGTWLEGFEMMLAEVAAEIPATLNRSLLAAPNFFGGYSELNSLRPFVTGIYYHHQ